MIEKMKYVKMTGPVDDLDRVAQKYISRFEIQFENTSKELSREKDLEPLFKSNPYEQALRSCENLLKLTGGRIYSGNSSMGEKQALELVEKKCQSLDKKTAELDRLKKKKDGIRSFLEVIRPYLKLSFSVEDLREFALIRYRFGRMPTVSFKQFESFLYSEPEILYMEGEDDGEHIYGMYLVCDFLSDKYDSIFSSLNFEWADFPLEHDGALLSGSPEEIYEDYTKRSAVLDVEIERVEATIKVNTGTEDTQSEETGMACAKLREMYEAYEIRKFAAKTKNGYYILVGWMTEKDARSLEEMKKGDDALVFIVEDDNSSIPSVPPTKIRNPFFFRPFEFFVRLYGLPGYGELDPTGFVAVTYTILFGIMFGDIGQGFVILLAGLILGGVKKIQLGRVMVPVGISSMIFGVVFGSVFGIELEEMALLSATHNTNELLIGGIGIGVFVVLMTMILNLINHFRSKSLAEAVFDPNGFAGFALYGMAILCVVLVLLKGVTLPWFVPLIAVILIFGIGFRHTLTELLKGEKPRIHGGIGIFLFESFIEMFEALLSYFTNTVSFVRVGAFALSHASLMGVVRMLAGEDGGVQSVLVMIVGNMIVLGLEGLIVGIQSLRIEFYEIFSRFYTGGGREFTPFVKRP